jgi:hypothetical protein
LNHATKNINSSHSKSLKHRLAKGEIPFEDVFSPQDISEAMGECGLSYRDRVFSPFVTLWLFLGQALAADGSCRAAIARFLSMADHPICSFNTGAYCKARKRLNVVLIKNLSTLLNKKLLDAQPSEWLWRGRSIKLIDGTTVSMPDTEENQQVFPQNSVQKCGLGFPLARMVVVLSGSCGGLLDAAIGSYQGKGTGETSLLRKLIDNFESKDLVIFDRLYSGFPTVAMFLSKGIDVVTRQHQRRKVDFRKGKRIGKNDQLIELQRPCYRPSNLSKEEHQNLPEKIVLREVRIRINRTGYRAKSITLLTSLLDAKRYPVQEISDLYNSRWHVELDIRNIKSEMNMDILRSHTPAMVEKEIWTHFLAYNLIRLLMAQAALKQEVNPRQLSFKATLQIFDNFRDILTQLKGKQWQAKYLQMLELVSIYRVGNRPNRYEPRAIKRRHLGTQDLLTEPRERARQRIARMQVP